MAAMSMAVTLASMVSMWKAVRWALRAVKMDDSSKVID
jgi:hypothetical protein